MHTVPQNKDKFAINNLFHCCEALIFTHLLVYEFLRDPKHMGTPVLPQTMWMYLLTKFGCKASKISRSSKTSSLKS